MLKLGICVVVPRFSSGWETALSVPICPSPAQEASKPVCKEVPISIGLNANLARLRG